MSDWCGDEAEARAWQCDDSCGEHRLDLIRRAKAEGRRQGRKEMRAERDEARGDLERVWQTANEELNHDAGMDAYTPQDAMKAIIGHARNEAEDELESLREERDRLAAENAAVRERLFRACDHLREVHGRHSMASHLVSGVEWEKATRLMLAARELAGSLDAECEPGGSMSLYALCDRRVVAYRKLREGE